MATFSSLLNLPFARPSGPSYFYSQRASQSQATDLESLESSFSGLNIAFPDAEAVFKAAFEEFQDGLVQDNVELEPCRNAQELILETKLSIMKGTSRNQSRLLAACRKIDAFGQTLEAYFQVVGILVSSHPEWAALAWGSLRLIFKLCSHHVTFFEKLAKMLEEMTEMLPDYDRQVNILMERAKISSWRPSHERLAKSLSYIYTDVMQFCYDACCMFSGRNKGFRRRARVVLDTFWTPFDKRFEKVLARFQEHTMVFNKAAREVLTEEFLQHLDKADFEIQLRSAEREKLADDERAWRVKDEKDRELEERTELEDRLADLRKWIAAPNWAATFEAIGRLRTENTGVWLMNHQVYQGWLDNSETIGQPGFNRSVLLLSAKPGYGKTVLSTQIIDHLQVVTPRDSLVTYFHFDQRNVELQSATASLRAILAQCLRARQNDRHLINVASMVLNKTGHGQTEASLEEVRSILKVYVAHFSPLYLVIDGLDECLDWEDFLRDAEDVFGSSNCKIVFLARQHIHSPILENISYHLTLGMKDNLDDIKSYLKPRMVLLLKKFNLDGKHSTEAITSEIANRASSMFLWAVLMYKYLSAPSLSPREWLFAVENLNLFEGLETMYLRILEDVQRRTPRSQWPKLRSIFQWLVVQQESWTINVMGHSLATQQDRPSTEEDFVPNLEEALPTMCGSLVEVDREGVVRFIHSSVSEFLTSTDLRSHMTRPFYVWPKDAHYSMAKLCLSYLAHNVKHEPLGGAASVVPDEKTTETTYPLLRYAALYWAYHTSNYLEIPHSTDQNSKSDDAKALIQAVYKAITDKLLVTTWIEASWLFKSPPRIENLATRVAITIRPESSIWQAFEGLSKSLMDLNSRWNEVLEKNPNEIWLPSINSISKSKFWVGTEAASFKSIDGQDHNQDMMVLASKVSHDGCEIGIVRVRSRKFSPLGESSISTTSSSSDTTMQDWELSYQICSLESMDPIIALDIKIPHSTLEELRFSGATVDYDHFRFPCTISPSLRMIILLGTLYQVHDLLTASIEPSYHHQVLRDRGCPHNPIYGRLLSNKERPKYFRQRNREDLAHIDHGGVHECYHWYEYYFSPDETYLVLLEGGGPPHSQAFRPPMYNSYILSVFKNSPTEEIGPAFSRLASVGIRCNMIVENILCVHPSRPLLAINLANETAIWKFDLNGKGLFRLCSSLNQMSFSQDGRFLIGRKRLEHIPIMFDIENVNGDPDSTPELALDEIRSKETNIEERGLSKVQSDQIIGDVNRFSSPSYLKTGSRPPIAESSTMALHYHGSGSLSISALKFQAKSVAVQHETLLNDGTGSQMEVTLLPNASVLKKSYPTLVSPAGSDPERIRLVLNMAAQQSYSASEKVDFPLPALIERTVASMPIEHYTWNTTNPYLPDWVRLGLPENSTDGSVSRVSRDEFATESKNSPSEAPNYDGEDFPLFTATDRARLKRKPSDLQKLKRSRDP